MSADPGSRNWSFSVVDFSKEKGKVLHNESYYLKQTHLGDRMLFLIEEGNRLIEKHGVSLICYEAPFFRGGQSNSMGIYWCTGILQILSASNKLPVHAYSAKEVKSKVANSGKADKGQVEAGVRTILGLDENFIIKDDHSSDSLAVAITCFKSLKA